MLELSLRALRYSMGPQHVPHGESSRTQPSKAAALVTSVEFLHCPHRYSEALSFPHHMSEKLLRYKENSYPETRLITQAQVFKIPITHGIMESSQPDHNLCTKS